MVDNLTLISGVDIQVSDGIVIRQPKLRDICKPDIGEARYNTYVSVFDLTVADVFGGDDAALPAALLEHMHIFDVLIGIDEHRHILLDALNFFLATTVVYDDAKHLVVTSDGIQITRDVFDAIAPIVLQINCVQQKRDTAKTYANQRAKRIFEKIQKAKEQQKRRGKSDPNYTIPNIVSKLSSKHPSYNLLNIWDLTIYQLYDQFACTCMNNQLDVIGLRWAAWGKEDFDFSQWYKSKS